MKKQNLKEQVSRIKNIMRSINEDMFDKKGNFMGGPNPDWESESNFQPESPDQYLKNMFGEDIDVEITDKKEKSGVNRHGDNFESVTFTMVYNGGQELPQEMYDALDNEYIMDGDELDTEDGGVKNVYYVTKQETYSGPEPDDY
jgi:hypothetical protein